ncbi:MAG: DUF4393 domain-containing protein [Rhodocyclales bacterium]|nr:DUF4393 domain-containing protein [Rhodocyclales bacterium]
MTIESQSLVSKESLGLLQLIYKDLASPGIVQVGLALSRTVQFVALPTLLIDWANRRASIALEVNLEKYRARLADNSKEDITEVPPEIGVEILQKLSYVTDADISDYYLNLLEKASIKRSAHLGHPRFVSMIASLSPDEARLLRWFHRLRCVPWMRIKLTDEESFRRNNNNAGIPLGFWSSEYTIGMDLEHTELQFPENLNKYIENILSLGIIEAEENEALIETELFRDMFAENLKEIRLVNKSYTNKSNVNNGVLKAVAGSFWLTKIGEMFLDVCCKPIHG